MVQAAVTLLLAVLACLGASGASARELQAVTSYPWCPTSNQPFNSFCGGPSQTCKCSPRAFKSVCGANYKCQVPTANVCPGFTSAYLDTVYADLVTGYWQQRAQYTSLAACCAGCSADANCDGFGFTTPSDIDYDDFPGCWIFQVEQGVVGTPCLLNPNDVSLSFARNKFFPLPVCNFNFK